MNECLWSNSSAFCRRNREEIGKNSRRIWKEIEKKSSRSCSEIEANSNWKFEAKFYHSSDFANADGDDRFMRMFAFLIWITWPRCNHNKITSHNYAGTQAIKQRTEGGHQKAVRSGGSVWITWSMLFGQCWWTLLGECCLTKITIDKITWQTLLYECYLANVTWWMLLSGCHLANVLFRWMLPYASRQILPYATLFYRMLDQLCDGAHKIVVANKTRKHSRSD